QVARPSKINHGNPMNTGIVPARRYFQILRLDPFIRPFHSGAYFELSCIIQAGIVITASMPHTINAPRQPQFQSMAIGAVTPDPKAATILMQSVYAAVTVAAR